MYNRSLIIAVASMSVACVLIGWAVLSDLKKETPEPVPEDIPEIADDSEKEEAKTYEVSIDYPESSRSAYADVTAVNNRGTRYTYRIFNQKAGYSDYSAYLSAHGCSTCALTSILRNVEGLEDLTPDRCLSEIQRAVAGDDVFNSNFSKAHRKQMPITLYGARKVFEKYRVDYKLPSADPGKREREITEWLRAGDPVLFTLGNGGEYGLSRGTHTILLLGIDDDGYVIIGDSLHKSASHWGRQGLVKARRLTVADMLSIIKTDREWSVRSKDTGSSHFFYKNPSDRGYLMVKINKEPDGDRD